MTVSRMRPRPSRHARRRCRARARLELVEVPACLRHANDWNFEIAPFHQRLQRRENLLLSQIPGCAKEYQGIRMRIVHSFIFTEKPRRQPKLTSAAHTGLRSSV
jgi:hypothetical protein